VQWRGSLTTRDSWRPAARSYSPDSQR
jgi:hypothetical protein